MRCGRARTSPKASLRSAKSVRPVMSETGTKADASLRPASHTLGDLVDEMAARRPAAEAIVFREERLDYAALKTRADAFARALLAVGVQHGDRVALLVTNRPEWIICSLAAAKIGGRSIGRSGITCCCPADSEAGRHLLHPLYLRLDRDAQGRNARSWLRH